jgi:hypothetical protein
VPYEGVGIRHTAVATKAVIHGNPTIEDGFEGIAFKVKQLGQFVDPTNVAARTIEVGETFEIQVGGIHEIVRSGNLAAAVVGNDVYIKVSDNTMGLVAQGLTSGVLTSGWKKFGKITARDTSRSPQILRVNSNDLGRVVGEYA